MITIFTMYVIHKQVTFNEITETVVAHAIIYTLFGNHHRLTSA
jgi:hypothetical protein